MKKHYSHGELNIFEGNKIPKGARKVSPESGRYILADSETTGNHHCLEEKEGVEVYELNGVLYVEASKEVDVFCVDTSRHDTITLSPSVWEIEPAKEEDHITRQLRNVAD